VEDLLTKIASRHNFSRNGNTMKSNNLTDIFVFGYTESAVLRKPDND